MIARPELPKCARCGVVMLPQQFVGRADGTLNQTFRCGRCQSELVIAIRAGDPRKVGR